MEQTVKYGVWQSNDYNYMTCHNSFGIFDSKRREIGCQMIINVANENTIVGYIQATRDGVKFGAVPVRSYHNYDSVEAAKAALDQKADKALKRIQREANKTNGVYAKT